MVILASSSPRRRELMKRIYPDYKIITADIDEESSYNLPPLEATLEIARRKGEKVKEDHYDDLIISADTIVVIDNQIIGKPVDEEDAKRLLHLLSGRTHEVITAYCLFYKDKFIEHYVSSFVTFYKLSDQLIEDYVKTGSPLDKAGAYGYQDNDKYPIVKEIKGSIDNVIGFPVEEIKKDFEDILKNA